MARRQGRITKEDIREAGFRRWDGRDRITTDWNNVFQEPELCWPHGDCLVYLREPGQSSRGPAFRIHIAHLRKQGFGFLLKKCVTGQPLHTSTQCSLSNRCVCSSNLPTIELYLPAPHSGLDATLYHHVTTRNFFAWLYNVPQAGRALGPALIALLERVNLYRPAETERNRAEVFAYLESQKYLDFRECADHALATLCFAEHMQEEDLWVDAFAHCVGLSHRGLHESVEYEFISEKSRAMIHRARLDVDLKLRRVADSIGEFFETDLSSTYWGLHQAARDHLDRFRSFLHSYYIEQHGFWPPEKFGDEVVQRLVCNTMYSDFRSLYHHLADSKSSHSEVESDLVGSGGVCVLQNLRSFDSRSDYQPLPDFLPQLPCEAAVDFVRTRGDRRSSWNPMVKRKLNKEERSARRMQALVNSTNRDWNLMGCLLVRRFSEFEVKAATDDLEDVSLADGRKVRWIAVYAILQILISVMQAPKQVRNTEGLSYSLCCKAPDVLPWQVESPRNSVTESKSMIEPDMAYSHTNTEPPRPTLSRRNSGLKEASETPETVSSRQSISRRASTLRSASLRRFLSNNSSDNVTEAAQKQKRRGSFCEIYVPGYGNGLNQVEVELTASPVDAEETFPQLPSSSSVSRESSNASSNTTWSKGSTDSASTAKTPDLSASDISQAMAELGLTIAKASDPVKIAGAIQIIPAEEGLETVHFNPRTWTDVLRR